MAVNISGFVEDMAVNISGSSFLVATVKWWVATLGKTWLHE
jgi:hypothetical protein